MKRLLKNLLQILVRYRAYMANAVETQNRGVGIQTHKSLKRLLEDAVTLETADYVLANIHDAPYFNRRDELWDFCVYAFNKNGNFVNNELVFAEFGVWKAESINYFAHKFPDMRLIGFDSFEGLEEDWPGTGLKAGHFSTGGSLPNVQGNVHLVKGWYSNTLPNYLRLNPHAFDDLRILHLDSDTYTPTKYILETLETYLRPGTIIIFDEYFGYFGYKAHEFRAFKEFIKKTGIKYKYIGFTEIQVAVELL